MDKKITKEQRARWLELANKSGCLVVADAHGISRVICEGETFTRICAAITAEAVAAERESLIKAQRRIGLLEIMHREACEVCEGLRTELAVERSRLAEGARMTDEETMALVEAHAYRKHDNSFEMTEGEARALIAEASARATAAERERCARIVEPPTKPYKGATVSHRRNLRLRLAEQIRSAAAHREGEE